MSKNVIVIASGETERRSLPRLLAHLKTEDVIVNDVRIPPRKNNALNVEMAEKLIRSAWFGNSSPPTKFVVLLDADGKVVDDVLRPFRDELPKRIGGKIPAALQFAVAQWHLESWYFADAKALKGYLGRALGNVDTSKPDEIQNPKLHLKQLLGDRMYTAVVSEEIASGLDAQVIAGCSPSFQSFLDAVKNGKATV